MAALSVHEFGVPLALATFLPSPAALVLVPAFIAFGKGLLHITQRVMAGFAAVLVHEDGVLFALAVLSPNFAVRVMVCARLVFPVWRLRRGTRRGITGAAARLKHVFGVPGALAGFNQGWADV